MKITTSMQITFVAIALCSAANLSAQSVTIVASFSGYGPSSPLAQGTNGLFYGEGTPEGIGSGNTYDVSPDGTITSLATLSSPFGGLVLASNGFLYGTDETGGTGLEGSIFRMSGAGQATTIYSFCTSTCDSSNPSTALLQVGQQLYGTTPGTIFRSTLNGAVTTLYNFCNPDCNQFGPPFPSALILGVDGNFYGTTAGGNVNDGTVFKVTPSGTLTTLHTFSGADGSSPAGSLVQGPNGDLYGMTVTGGNSNSGCNFGSSSSCGTIFKISRGGTFTTLHRFAATDGANPQGSLVLGSDNNFYGVTYQGGSSNAGTIFQLVPGGKLTTLYDFCAQQFCLDGATPRTGLMQSTNASFYGTTFDGGEQGLGVIYSLSMDLGPFVQTAPASAAAGSKVIILGDSLSGSTRVTFNGVSALFTVVSETEIMATVPSGATTGKVQVTTPLGVLTSNVVFRVIR